MNQILDHIDELLFLFPVNKVTKKMRSDLVETTEIDFENLTNDGMDEQEASDLIISHIAPAKTFATMIPNGHSLYYYVCLALGIVLTALVFTYISHPDFLQIFLPARMEFPDIIEKYILYFFITLISYVGIHLFYRLLPQKYLSRTPFQEAIFLYIGTLMAAAYFSVAIAFIWFTFNGYLPHEIKFNLLSTCIYIFYQLFFSSEIVVALYAIVNGLMFVLSHHHYHLEKKPQPYSFEAIYQMQTQKKKEEPLSSALIVTEEVIDFLHQNH